MLNLFRRHPGDIGDSDVEIGLIRRTLWHILHMQVQLDFSEG